jgi:hypothetical protein
VYRLPFLRLIRPRGYAPVGRLGVEPSDTALSGRPRRPAGSRPMRGRWRCRASRCYPSRGFRPRCGAGRASSMAESGGNDPQRANADPLSKRSPRPGGFTLHANSPARCEQTGDGRGRSARCPAPCDAHTLSKRSRPPDRFILYKQKATDSNGTVSPAHPLATEPGS